MSEILLQKFTFAKQKEGALFTLEARQKALSQLHNLLKKEEQVIVNTINADFGHRSVQETIIGEFFPLHKELHFVKKHLKSWIKPKRVRTDIWYQPAHLKLHLQPLGTVGIIAPWNFPLILSISPLIAAIAAGNSCLVKISEFTPCFGELLSKLIDTYLGDTGIGIINGDVSVAEGFAELPFNHILFTGASSIGKKVMASASKNLTPVTLELGGKSPTIIDDKINMNTAMRTILRGKLLNAGQICVAPDYVLLPSCRLDEFIASAKKITKTFYPTWLNNPDYTNIINAKHMQRLHHLQQDALQKGATWIPLSEVMENSEQKFQPGLLVDVTEDMLVMQEEIFGPILPVKTITHTDEAIHYINEHPHPLTIYAFTHDKQLQQKLVQNTLSGSISFNEVLLQIVQNRVPFGGVGQSGFGQYRGRFGVETFSKKKPVYYQGKIKPASLFTPPYGKLFSYVTKFLVK